MRFSSRLDTARHSLEKIELDALILTNLQDIRYLTGFSGSAGLALLCHERADLFIDFRYMAQAAEETVGFEIIPVASALWDSLIDRVKEVKVHQLGFVSSELSCDQYRKLREKGEGAKLYPLQSLIGQLRMVKDQEEADAIRRSAHLLSSNLAEILSLVKPGIKEKEIAALFEYGLNMNGAEKVGFETIVASGPRSAMPHAHPSSRVVGTGELLKIDGGCQWQGYHSDITRTLVVGAAKPDQRRIHQIVLEAHDQAVAWARPGINAEELDAMARKVIEDAGYGPYFGHGTGHGVGLSVHEEPIIGKGSRVLLEEGMAFTIEPGIYLPGFGGVRIEDTVLLTASGAEVVTTTSREMTL